MIDLLQPPYTLLPNLVYRSATGRSAAIASLLVGMKGHHVIKRDLFAGPDIAESEEEYMVVENFHVAVRRAGMIDIMRAVATETSVQAPPFVDRADA